MYDFHRTTPNRKPSAATLLILGGLLLVAISACNPHDRFLRLVKHNPYLLELYRSDSIKIQTFESTDTLLFFKSQTDTLRTENTIIYRDSNTIRLVRYERPCTTYISKSINIPSKQKVIKETQYKNDWEGILKWICLLVSLIGLFNLVAKWKA
jgi:hypothetical protein